MTRAFFRAVACCLIGLAAVSTVWAEQPESQQATPTAPTSYEPAQPAKNSAGNDAEASRAAKIEAARRQAEEMRRALQRSANQLARLR
jgi:hypothetical protein